MTTPNGAPRFPEFAPLELRHKPLLDHYGVTYGRYSDFNFTTLFCWNTNGAAAVSLLNDNLVIRRPDYDTCESCHSILGSSDLDASLATLMDEVGPLEKVPETVVSGLRRPERFAVTEDPASHDYLFRVRDHVELRGRRYKKLRNKLHRFERDLAGQPPVQMVRVARVDEERLARYDALLREWVATCGHAPEHMENEGHALMRLLRHSDALDLVILEFSQDGHLVAFSITEVLGGGHAIAHFQKARRIHPYFTVFINLQEAAVLDGLGCRYVNWEEDTGDPGLRIVKSSYAPAGMLRKYRVTLLESGVVGCD